MANDNGTKLVAYNCPVCLEKLHTTQAPNGEVWDTFSNCPFCQALLFKVTCSATVKIELITKIGRPPTAQPCSQQHRLHRLSK